MLKVEAPKLDATLTQNEQRRFRVALYQCLWGNSPRIGLVYDELVNE